MTLTLEEVAALRQQLGHMYLGDPVLVALAQRLLKEAQ